MQQVTVAILLDKFVNASSQVSMCPPIHVRTRAHSHNNNTHTRMGVGVRVGWGRGGGWEGALSQNVHRQISRSVPSAGRQQTATISFAAQSIHFLHDLPRYSVCFPCWWCPRVSFAQSTNSPNSDICFKIKINPEKFRGVLSGPM